jgi:hypothetical protein
MAIQMIFSDVRQKLWLFRRTKRWLPPLLLLMALVLGRSDAGVAQQAGRGPVNADGTWRLGDGTSSGKWTARFEVTPTGVLSGTIALNGMGDGSPAEIEGAVDGDQINFGLVSTRANTPADKQSVCAFEGTIRGARVKGTFSDPQGREGRWDGWWNSGGRKAQGQDEPAGPTVIFVR